MKTLRGSASAAVRADSQRCARVLGDVGRYPDWYPEAVRSVDVLEQDGQGRPTRAQVKLHFALGPLARDFELLFSISHEPSTVKLSRIPHEPDDEELFDVTWRLGSANGPGTTVEVALDARLDVPRLAVLPGGIGDSVARGFIAAAARELDREPEAGSASGAGR